MHSFLISASLTDVSPVWASVSGYYSSHYSIKAIAHLLGFFQLFSIKRAVQLEFTAGHFIGTFSVGRDREHHVYWEQVKRNSLFAGDPFFTDNNAMGDQSDVGHRDRANYADHLPHFPNFAPLERERLRNRVAKISSIEVKTPPIPAISKYPDLEAVQVVAYHRLVKYRDLVDAILGADNRYWNVHRDPPWARDFVDFQLTDANARRAELNSP